ncbi:unnamed protein product [Periconia digitata]|uniref:Uncharacterized protein n=1 Tax=Periconia digitata TaxID=1303443 RepID=A0A9W4U0J2_9PLEO|nr:unnamed protein product [Periconia digitata]
MGAKLSTQKNASDFTKLLDTESDKKSGPDSEPRETRKEKRAAKRYERYERQVKSGGPVPAHYLGPGDRYTNGYGGGDGGGGGYDGGVSGGGGAGVL